MKQTKHQFISNYLTKDDPFRLKIIMIGFISKFLFSIKIQHIQVLEDILWYVSGEVKHKQSHNSIDMWQSLY
jgi:hypothetical protein